MNFNQQVYNLVKKIPKGKVSSYKIIANKLGCKAYRAVGNALKNNPTPIIIPCHRVVKSNSELGGFTSKKYDKKTLLEKEGIKIIGGKIVDFKKRLFKF